MRFQLHLATAALMAAIGIGGVTTARAADRDARAAVLGRQEIREELSAALAKGYLTRMDQYHILLHAKEVLSADDLHGLEQTLDRLATQQSTTRAPEKLVRSEPAVQQDSDENQPVKITPSKYEQPAAEEVPAAIGEPMAKKAMPMKESPDIEQDPSTIGKPAMQIDSGDSDGCGCDSEECRPTHRWFEIEAISAVDAFKGPIDIGNANGNFGAEEGVNAAVSILPRYGIALQAGTNIVLSNLKGTPYPEPNSASRDQFFVTAGLFQRLNLDAGNFTWGFAYDWLFDNYYDNFTFAQWRVKAAWEFSPCDELGVTAALPDRGSSGTIPVFLGGTELLHFKPITQGYLYWKHTWSNDASLAGHFGLAERPGEFVFGADSRVPLTKNLAMTGNYSYIMPSAGSGPIGQTQEIWNISLGLEFTLGGFKHGGSRGFEPFIPVADNGSMAVRELGQ